MVWSSGKNKFQWIEMWAGDLEVDILNRKFLFDKFV